jgi:hypothetical protein
MRARARRLFAITLATTVVSVVSAAGLLNYLVDPYAIFGGRAVAGFNAIKPRPDAMLADIKFIVGTHARADALILGNSRAEVGFDPRHPAFAARGLHAFNAAVPGSDTAYTLEALERLNGASRVDVAIIGIDFVDFLTRSDASATPQSGLRDPWLARFLALFSTTATLDSLRTIAIQHQKYPATLRTDGFNPMLDYIDIAAHQGYAVLFRQRAEQGARSLARAPHNLYAGERGTSPALANLAAILDRARAEAMDVNLVMYPYHLLLLLQFDAAGLSPLLEQWKRDVTTLAESARTRGTRVTVWDFACPHPITAERVPLAGDLRSDMRWYWEAGHFKKALGDVVLNKALDWNALDTSPDFGVSLTAANIDQRITHCRSALAVMRERFPGLAREAEELANAASGVESRARPISASR